MARFTKEHNDLRWLFPTIYHNDKDKYAEEAFDMYKLRAEDLLSLGYSTESFTKDDMIDAFMKGASEATRNIMWEIQSIIYNGDTNQSMICSLIIVALDKPLEYSANYKNIITEYIKTLAIDNLYKLAEKLREYNIDITINRSFSMNCSYYYEIVKDKDFDNLISQNVIADRPYETALRDAIYEGVKIKFKENNK